MTNFHEAWVCLRQESEQIRVFCNAHHAIIAFVWPPAHEGDTQLRFVDCPELAQVLSSDFRILSFQEATAHVSPEAMVPLGESERKQIRYWNPQRIGDVVFNGWD